MRARDNPLTVQRLGRLRYRIAPADWEDLLARFAAHRYRGAVVGPEGHGKTTLLADLMAHFRAAAWDVRSVRLQRGQGVLTTAERRLLFAPPTARTLLVVDGVDELSAVERLLLRWRARRAGGLLVAAHREGALPTLRRCETDAALLETLLDELGIAATRPGEATAALLARHHGNLREVFSELYDLYAALPDPPSR